MGDAVTQRATAQPWLRRMVPRDRDEPHRTSTPLELLFDLCFLVAIAQVADQLHHGFAEGDFGLVAFHYVVVFFGIWWAWMNFTWFASAYDTDDVPYRLLTLLQIAGGLVLAAGVPAAFNNNDFRMTVAGYVVMRIAMTAQWLRAAHDYPKGRPCALRYALGFALCQVGWVARLFVADPWATATIWILGAAELAVPIWAERAGVPTSWHPEHIVERYRLFTIIVLGECVFAATTAIQASITEEGLSLSTLEIAAGGLLLVFGLWWWYFKSSAAERLRGSLPSTFIWGYGHFPIFAAVAALGAGLQFVTDIAGGAQGSPVTAALTVAIPVVLYLTVLGLLRAWLDRVQRTELGSVIVASVLLLIVAWSASFLPVSIVVMVMGTVVAALVAFHVVVDTLAADTDDGIAA